MKHKILCINGPNLEMLGKRETTIYGKSTLKDIENLLVKEASQLDCEITFFQSNHEGDLITTINQLNDSYTGIIINPAAYSHTSIAIYDSLKNKSIYKVEVHISNIYEREEFRKNSITSGACDNVISGFGIDGYILALKEIINQ